MHDTSWLTHLITITVLGLVMGLLARARKPAEVRGRTRMLGYPRAFAIVMGICTAFFLLLTPMPLLAGVPKALPIGGFFLAFAVLGGVPLVEALRVRHELRDECIVYRGLFRQNEVPWIELASVRWSPAMKSFTLKTNDGRKLHFSALLNGLDTLAQMLHDRAPLLRADPATTKILADAREGKLPSAWE